MDASIAENLETFRALMGGAGARMTRANQPPIGQYNGGSGAGNVKFRYGDNYFSALDQHFNVADAEVLTLGKLCLLDLLIVYESPVSRAEIAHREFVIRQRQFAMKGRNRRMLELEVVLRAAPDTRYSQFELDYLVFKPLGLDQQACHKRTLPIVFPLAGISNDVEEYSPRQFLNPTF